MSELKPGTEWETQRKSVAGVPWFYTAITREIRRHMLRRGWPMWMLDDRAGIADGHSAKLLNPASNTGRMGTHFILDLVVTALAGRGFKLLIVPADFDETDGRAVRALIEEQDVAEVERVSMIIERTANTDRIPRMIGDAA